MQLWRNKPTGTDAGELDVRQPNPQACSLAGQLHPRGEAAMTIWRNKANCRGGTEVGPHPGFAGRKFGETDPTHFDETN
jgi:hypothetical protein